MKYPKPIRAWAIAHESGEYPFLLCGHPELFRTRAIADSQNIDRLNGSRVIRVEIRATKPKKTR